MNNHLAYIKSYLAHPFSLGYKEGFLFYGLEYSRVSWPAVAWIGSPLEKILSDLLHLHNL